MGVGGGGGYDKESERVRVHKTLCGRAGERVGLQERAREREGGADEPTP